MRPLLGICTACQRVYVLGFTHLKPEQRVPDADLFCCGEPGDGSYFRAVLPDTGQWERELRKEKEDDETT